MQVTENTVTGKSAFWRLFYFLCKKKKKKPFLLKAQFCPFINHKLPRKFSKWINQTLQNSRFKQWKKMIFQVEKGHAFVPKQNLLHKFD